MGKRAPKTLTTPQRPKLTADTAIAIANAGRLLEFAEMETDLAKMERYEKLGDSWISLASLLTGRERDA